MDLRLILKNAAALSVASVLSKAISAVVGIIVARYLGPDIFGEYGTALAYVGIFILFADFGLSNYMVQEGSRDESVLPLYLGNTLLFKLISTLAIFVLMLVFMPSVYNLSIRNMIIVFALAGGLNALDSTVYNYFQAKQQMYLAAMFQFLSTFLIGTLTILVVFKQGDVLLISFAQLVTAIIISLLLYLYLRRHIRLIFKPRLLLGMLKGGLPFGLAVIFLYFYFQIDTFMLSLKLPSFDVGIFKSAYGLVSVLMFIPGILTSVIYPILFQLGVTSKEQHQGTIEKIFKVLSAVGIAGSLLLFVLADPLITWLYDNRYPESIPIMMLLSWVFALECLSFSLGDVLTTTNRQWTRVWIQGSAAVLKVALNIYAIPRYGIYGASVATLLVEVFIFVMYYVIVRHQVYKVRIWRQLPVILLASAAMGFTAFFLRHLHPLVSGTIAGILFLIILIGLDKDFRRIGRYILSQITCRAKLS